MSLGLAIVAPEGVVLAAESRLTLSANQADGTPVHVNYDNAVKLLAFNPPNGWVGAVTYGQATIGNRTAGSFLTELEAALPDNRLSISDFARAMSDFYMTQWHAVMPSHWANAPMMFLVGGYDDDAPYGTLFEFQIPSAPDPLLRHASGAFGIVWGGQREYVDRIVQGYDSRLPEVVGTSLGLQPDQQQVMEAALRGFQIPLPLQAMPLQDCVDLAILFIRTTIDVQRLTVGIRGVGGPIDVATITRRSGLEFIQRKVIRGQG